MFRVYLGVSHGLADALEVRDVLDGIELADVVGIDAGEAEELEAAVGEFGVVTEVGEKFGAAGSGLIFHVANFAIEGRSGKAFAKDTAEEILFIESGEHERGGKKFSVVEHVHFFGLEIFVGAGRGAGADGNEQEFLFPRGPIEFVSLDGSHQKKLEGGIVVGGDAAIDEKELVRAHANHFRREVDGRGSGGANELPERDIEIAVGKGAVVEFRVGIVADGPGRVGGGVAEDHH